MFSFLNVFSSLPSSQEREKPVIHSLEVESNIRYRYAHTVIASKVYNSNDAAQELALNTTLPETAFVSSFSLEVDGKVYNAYVKEKEEAKKVYMEAVEHGRTAGHVCIRDSNQFSVSVNIAPKKEITFLLKYEELLNRKLGRYKHVINLNPGQIVPQFRVVINIQESTDITTIKVPELKNSDEDQDAQLEDVAKITVAPTSTIAEFIVTETTNTTAIVERPDPHSAVVKYEPTEEQQRAITNDGVKGQFIVLYDVDRTFQPTQLLVNDGYFAHFFAPEELKPLSKHVVFVLDISGSMHGRKVEQLKQAMEKILTDLHSQDYFSLIAFSNNTTVWRLIGNGRWDKAAIMECDWKRLVIPATPANVLKAKEAIQMLQANGGTNMYEAMMIASHITKLRSKIPLVKSENETATGQPESTVIFLTDGQPTVGNCNQEEIVNETTRWNQTSKATIFTLGLGTDVNFDFLKKLALHNSGFSRKIYEASDTALQLMDFYKEVSSPLVSNIMFTYLPDQVDADSLTQHNFPTFYLGNELIVCGRLEDELPEEDMGFEIIGHTSDGERHFHPQNMNIRFLHETGFMERMWAYLTIQQLLKDTKCLEKNLADEKKQHAIQLALKFSFVTPVTSLVVVQPEGKEQGQEASLTELGMTSAPLQVKYRRSHQPLLQQQPRHGMSLSSGVFGSNSSGNSTAFAGCSAGYPRRSTFASTGNSITFAGYSTASTGNSMAFAVNPTASTGNSMAFAVNSTASTDNAMTFAGNSTGFTGIIKGFTKLRGGGPLTVGTLSSDNMATEDSDVEYFIDGIISNGNLFDEMVNTERGKKYLGSQELLKGNVYKRISDKAYKTDNEIRKMFSDANICIKFDQIFLENHYLLCVNGYCILGGEVKVKTLGCIVYKDCDSIDSKNCSFELKSIISGLQNVFLAVINSHTKNNCVVEQSQNNAKLIEKEKCIMQTLFSNDIPGLKCITQTLLLAIPDFFRGIENTFISIKSVLSKLNVPNPETEMFDSASSLLYLIENLNNIDCSEKFIRELNISPNEFGKLAEIGNALICMKPALVNLQNEQLIFNTLYGSWTDCITKISQLGTEPGKALGACMEEKMAEVLEDPIYLAALFLDPKYKMVLSEDERRLAEEELHRLGHIFSEKNASLVKNTSGIIEKLKEYEKVSELNKDDEVLDYWESQKEIQPELYKLATAILSVPVSEASVYRMVSNKKLLLSSMPRQIISNIMKIK